MHPRLSVNAICSMQQSFEDDLVMWADLGVDNVGLISPKLEAVGWDVARQAVLDAGLVGVEHVVLPGGIAPTLEFAGAIGTPVLYVITGGAGPTPWEEAARAVLRRAGPARGRGAGSSASGSPSSRPTRCAPT